MIKYEDECVGCPPELGCIGTPCPYRDVAHYYCDSCGEEVDDLYKYDGLEMCAYCVLGSLEKVGEENA